MIRLDNLTKVFFTGAGRKVVAQDLNMTFPTGSSVALLGRNGAGKSTLLNMIAGIIPPTSGRIVTSGSISYPVGFAGSFHPELSGAQNTRFVARIYGAETDALIDFVRDFAELGSHFYMPIKTYSSGMKGRLSFGVSMGIAFDTYLLDEAGAVGDAAFKERSNQIFHDRMSRAGAVMVSHSMGQVRELCDRGVVLEHGHVEYYHDLEAAIDKHLFNMRKHQGG